MGDIIYLRYGHDVPVDGIFLSGNQFTTGEAEITGDRDESRKETFETCMKRKEEIEKGNL